MTVEEGAVSESGERAGAQKSHSVQDLHSEQMARQSRELRSCRAAQNPQRRLTSDSSELLIAILLGEGVAYDMFTGESISHSPTKPIAEEGVDHASVKNSSFLEVPRYCPVCARRMIVQVLPHGWTARCSRHGNVDSSVLEE